MEADFLNRQDAKSAKVPSLTSRLGGSLFSSTWTEDQRYAVAMLMPGLAGALIEPLAPRFTTIRRVIGRLPGDQMPTFGPRMVLYLHILGLTRGRR